MNRPLRQALQDALPIVLAYLPLAATFGLLATSHGIVAWTAVLISAWIYAGGAQFIFISMIWAGVSPFSTIVSLLVVNLRHFFYGTALGQAFAAWPEGKKWIAAFGLTDEVFTVTGTRLANKNLSPHYQLPFEGLCYSAWVVGTLLGAIIGHAAPARLSAIFTFALPALFLALLLMGKRGFAALSAAACGAAIAVLATLLQWGNVGIVLGAIGGATLGFVLQRWLHL